MQELQRLFSYEGRAIRVVVINDEPWWVAKDVCEVLGHTNTSMLLANTDDEERAKFNLGRQGETNIVSESGLYSLILYSRKPEAKVFKKWVTSEVLPTIRKHGAYVTPAVMDNWLNDPDQMIKALEALKVEREKNKMLKLDITQRDQIIGELRPKADYVDRILRSTGLMTISQIAKDYGMSAQELNSKLHDLKIQYKQNDQWLLYKDHHSKGYTHSRTVDLPPKNGIPRTKLHTNWTQKGRLFIYEELKKIGIVPMIEKN